MKEEKVSVEVKEDVKPKKVKEVEVKKEVKEEVKTA
jgi:hypothetical protein